MTQSSSTEYIATESTFEEKVAGALGELAEFGWTICDDRAVAEEVWRKAPGPHNIKTYGDKWKVSLFFGPEGTEKRGAPGERR